MAAKMPTACGSDGDSSKTKEHNGTDYTDRLDSDVATIVTARIDLVKVLGRVPAPAQFASRPVVARFTVAIPQFSRIGSAMTGGPTSRPLASPRLRCCCGVAPETYIQDERSSRGVWRAAHSLDGTALFALDAAIGRATRGVPTTVARPAIDLPLFRLILPRQALIARAATRDMLEMARLASGASH
eukprot:1601275-Prymnesium_polylepis.2